MIKEDLLFSTRKDVEFLKNSKEIFPSKYFQFFKEGHRPSWTLGENFFDFLEYIDELQTKTLINSVQSSEYCNFKEFCL